MQPKTFSFSIGGFPGPDHTLTWRNGALHYAHRPPGARLAHTTILHPTADQWRRFWRAADTARLFQWPRDCTTDDMICDGTQWRLHITHNGRTARSRGNNGYPFTDGPQHSPEFDCLLKALDELTGAGMGR